MHLSLRGKQVAALVRCTPYKLDFAFSGESEILNFLEKAVLGVAMTKAGPRDSRAGNWGSRSEKLAHGPPTQALPCCVCHFCPWTLWVLWLWFQGAVWCIAFKIFNYVA